MGRPKKRLLTAISRAKQRLGSSDPGPPLRCTRGEIDGGYAGLLLSCWVFGVARTTAGLRVVGGGTTGGSDHEKVSTVCESNV
jgi:hypothetical protein